MNLLQLRCEQSDKRRTENAVHFTTDCNANDKDGGIKQILHTHLYLLKSFLSHFSFRWCQILKIKINFIIFAVQFSDECPIVGLYWKTNFISQRIAYLWRDFFRHYDQIGSITLLVITELHYFYFPSKVSYLTSE